MIADPALVVVDMQRHFCRPGYDYVPVDRAEAISAVVERTTSFLDRYRGCGLTPIFVRTYHDPTTNSAVWTDKYGGSDGPCRPGSPGAELLPELGVTPDDPVVTKHRYDAFYDTALSTYLSANDVSQLLIAGVATHVCVESTARSAFDRDYRVTVLSDCTASVDPGDHRQALSRIDGQFGRVRSSTVVELPGGVDPGPTVRGPP